MVATKVRYSAQRFWNQSPTASARLERRETGEPGPDQAQRPLVEREELVQLVPTSPSWLVWSGPPATPPWMSASTR